MIPCDALALEIDKETFDILSIDLLNSCKTKNNNTTSNIFSILTLTDKISSESKVVIYFTCLDTTIEYDTLTAWYRVMPNIEMLIEKNNLNKRYIKNIILKNKNNAKGMKKDILIMLLGVSYGEADYAEEVIKILKKRSNGPLSFYSGYGKRLGNSLRKNKNEILISALKNDLYSNNLHYRKVAKYILQGYGYNFGKREDR